MRKKAQIALLATGGTIACVHTEKGFVPGLSGAELIASVPELEEVADLSVKQLMNIDSSDMSVADWRMIARACHKASESHDGIVITHGTDTMCYTASALSFMLGQLKIPVVLTGSQLPFHLADSDGKVNILDACLVAGAKRPGVSIVFNKKIINGPRGFKMYSKNKDAYVSRNYPYLGRLAGSSIIWEHTPRIMQAKDALNTHFCPDVLLIKLTPATDPSILDYVAAYGYRGVVIEGFGTGGISNLKRGMATAIKRLHEEKNIPVLMISQCPYDGLHLAVYGIGDDAAKAGVIPGNDMTTEAAVVKMMWALGQTQDREEILHMMAQNYCDEMTPSVTE